MNDKLVPSKKTTVSTGKGESRQIIAGKTAVSSDTGKVKSGNQVDLVFVFDTTGSMDDEIDGLLRTCAQFVEEAQKLDLDVQFALISFGDISVQGGGDRIELVVSPTGEVEKMKYGLSHIPRNNGFGNVGESCFEAIRFAFKLPYREKAVKVMVVITDEPAHQHKISSQEIINELATLEFLTFVISESQPYYKEMAMRNGGVWKEIGPHSSLDEILTMFKEMAKKVSQIAKDVHKLGKGSVKRYLELKPPGK